MQPQTSAVWRPFDERAMKIQDAILEVRSYLEEPLIQRAANLLSWLETKATIYPRLVEVMAG